MILSMSQQSWLFILNVGLGFLIGFIYDLFRIIRKLFKHPNFLTNIEDVVYWVVVSFLVFCFMLNKNYGEIRAFSIIGTLIGKVLYFLTVSPYVIKITLSVIHFGTAIVTKTVYFLSIPIKFIIKILLAPFIWLGRLFYPLFIKISKPCKKFLHGTKNYAKIKKRAILKDIKILMKKT